MRSDETAHDSDDREADTPSRGDLFVRGAEGWKREANGDDGRDPAKENKEKGSDFAHDPTLPKRCRQNKYSYSDDEPNRPPAAVNRRTRFESGPLKTGKAWKTKPMTAIEPANPPAVVA